MYFSAWAEIRLISKTCNSLRWSPASQSPITIVLAAFLLMCLTCTCTTMLLNSMTESTIDVFFSFGVLKFSPTARSNPIQSVFENPVQVLPCWLWQQDALSGAVSSLQIHNYSPGNVSCRSAHPHAVKIYKWPSAGSGLLLTCQIWWCHYNRCYLCKNTDRLTGSYRGVLAGQCVSQNGLSFGWQRLTKQRSVSEKGARLPSASRHKGCAPGRMVESVPTGKVVGNIWFCSFRWPGDTHFLALASL